MPTSSDPGGELVVNCSLAMQKLSIAERLRRVRDAGISSVEFWWPFSVAGPDTAHVDAFASEIERAEVTLVALNLFAGDMPAGERGVLSSPRRANELWQSAEVALALSERLGVRRFNVLYGNRLACHDAREQDEHAQRMLAALAPRFAAVGGVLLIEPVSGAPEYPILRAEDAANVVGTARADGAENVAMLLDLYHLAINGDDVDAAIRRHYTITAHVQLADAPGRGVPGTGELALRGWVEQLRSLGYTGRIALECAGDDPLSTFDPHTWKRIS